MDGGDFLFINTRAILKEEFLMEKIIIFDTTLRDGEQTPGVNLNLNEKVEIARQLERLGVDVIEAGFANASKGDFDAVCGVAAAISNATVCSLARAVPADIERAAEAVKGAKRPRIHTFIATSDVHMQYKLKMSEEQVLQRTIDSVTLARKLCEDVEFSPEDGSRTRPEFLYRVLEAAIAAGATTLNIPDTVGYSGVVEFGELIRGIKEHVKGIHKAIISVHCHNDLGLAVANSMQAILEGARQVEGAFNGLGERAGNAAIEEMVMNLSTRADYYGVTHNINTKQISRTSRLVSTLTGVDCQPNKAIVGKNAFLHESGIHQHGMLAERTTYEIMRPEDVGITVGGMVLGKLSGKHAFCEHIKEMGYTLSDEEAASAFARFKDLCDRKKEVSDADIEALLGEKLTEAPTIYSLQNFQVVAGNQVTGTATIALLHEGQMLTEAAVGDGPIDASFRAIDRIVQMDGCVELVSYAIKAVTGGKDALGEVTVRVKSGGVTVMGKGVATDVVESSIIAYINAINRLVFQRQSQS